MSAQATEAAPTPRQATSLYELVERMRIVLARVDELEGEVDDSTAAEMDALSSSLEERVEVIAAVYRALHEEAEACDRLARPYLDRAKRKRAQADALKLRLHAAMQECGRLKITTDTVTAAIQRNPAGVEILVPEHEAAAKLPAEYLETRTVIRKDAIKAALLGGATLDFARLTTGTHLRLR